MALTSYRFGPFRLLPAARELWRDQERLSLPPRAFDCLVHLVEQRDRAVGRDELIATVWGRTEVSDAMIAQTILRIRRTLGDEAASQEWVRTVPRFGYRWAAPTQVETTEIDSARADPAETLATPATTSPNAIAPANRRRWVAVATTLVAVLALALALSVHRAPSTDDGRDKAQATTLPASRWIVLPVVSEGAAAPSWIRLGVMDAIAERLRQADLPVLPSTQALVLADEYARVGEPADIGRLREAGGGQWLVTSLARPLNQGWQLQLTLHDPDRSPAQFEGSGADVLAAAHAAVTALLSARGHTGAPGPGVGAKQQLLVRVEAAMLAGRLAEAESLLAARPAELANDAQLLLKQAQIQNRQGRGMEALSLIETVLARSDIDADTRGQALIRAGGAHVRAGDGVAAGKAFREALEHLPADRREALGEAWNGVGIAEHMQGEFAASAGSLARARALLAQGSDQLAYARTLINQGLLAMVTGRPHEGLERYLEAEPIVLRFGAADEQVGLQVSVAWSRLFLGQFRAADESAQRAVALSQRTENPLVRRQAYGFAIRTAVKLGRLALAEHLIEQIAALPANQHQALRMYRALLAEARASWPEALRLAGESLDLDQLDRDGQGESARVLLESALILNDHPAIRRSLAVFAKLADGDESGRWQRWQVWAQMRIHDHAGDHTAAEQGLREQWQSTVQQQANPSERLEIGLALADVLLKRQQTEAAQAIVDQLAPWRDEDYRLALIEIRLAQSAGDSDRLNAARENARALAGERALPVETVTDSAVESDS